MKLQIQSLIVSGPCVYNSKSMQSEQCALRRWPIGFQRAITYRLASTRVVDPESPRLSVRSPAGRQSGVRAQLQDRDRMVETPDSFHSRQSIPNALDYQVPTFTPFSNHKLNPLMDEAVKGSHEWAVQHFGTIIDARQLKKISEANIHRLPCGIYSTASLSRLEWVVEYFLLLYIWDDEVLHRQLETSRRGVAQIYLEVQLAIMSTFPDDKILRETLAKYLVHFSDHESTRIRVEKVLALAGQHQDIGVSYMHSVSGLVDKSNLRDARRVEPPFRTHNPKGHVCNISRGTGNGPVHTTVDFSLHSKTERDRICRIGDGSCRLCGRCIPAQQDILHPSMQRLLQSTIDAICWHNDIWSFPKELVAGEVYNLVYLVSKERECSYNKAAEIVNHMVVDECNKMQLGAAELRVYSKLYDLTVSESDAIEKYIACCNAWISSTHAFHSSSSRFRS